MPPLVLSLWDDALLTALRYLPPDVTKCGLLPFRRRASAQVMEFLLAAPRPKHSRETRLLPFAIARGTMEAEIRDGEGSRRIELGRSEIGEATLLRREQPVETALREGGEELGIQPAGIIRLYDAGPLRYKTYGIHVFLAALDPACPLAPAKDSRAVRWMTLDEARRCSGGTVEPADRFNPEYLPLLEGLSALAESAESWTAAGDENRPQEEVFPS